MTGILNVAGLTLVLPVPRVRFGIVFLSIAPRMRPFSSKLGNLIWIRSLNDSQVPSPLSLRPRRGHHVVAFRPDLSTWPGKVDAVTLHTCTRCLRISSGGWDVKCKDDSFTDVSKLRLRWKDIRESGKNCKLLCAIWGKT